MLNSFQKQIRGLVIAAVIIAAVAMVIDDRCAGAAKE